MAQFFILHGTTAAAASNYFLWLWFFRIQQFNIQQKNWTERKEKKRNGMKRTTHPLLAFYSIFPSLYISPMSFDLFSFLFRAVSICYRPWCAWYFFFRFSLLLSSKTAERKKRWCRLYRYGGGCAIDHEFLRAMTSKPNNQKKREPNMKEYSIVCAV